MIGKKLSSNFNSLDGIFLFFPSNVGSNVSETVSTINNQATLSATIFTSIMILTQISSLKEKYFIIFWSSKVNRYFI